MTKTKTVEMYAGEIPVLIVPEVFICDTLIKRGYEDEIYPLLVNLTKQINSNLKHKSKSN